MRRRLPAAVVLLDAALIGVGVVVGWIGARPRPALRLGELGLAVMLAAVGWLLASRRPANPVGWLFCVSSLSAAWLFMSNQMPPDRLWVWFAWSGSWSWLLAPGLPAAFVLLLFPDGTLPSRRWRPVAWSGGAGLAIIGITSALMPFEQSGVGGPGENPLWVPGTEEALEMVFLAGVLLFLVAVAGGVGALVVRFRRSRGAERQQVKWVTYAALAAVALFATNDLTTRLPFVTHDMVLFGAMALFLSSVALAILRYRLYDLDRIVSRTVSYALLTVVLAGLYIAAVVGFQQLMRPLTGGADLAVAASTLIAAAAFVPMRRRVQGAVDRRFNRARYDAARTMEVFSARLRDEIDLQTLRSDLEVVLRRTMQPAHVSLWVDEAAPRREPARTGGSS